MRGLRVIKQVEPSGGVRLDSLPFAPGETVEILVLSWNGNRDDINDLSESGLKFWDNDVDDRVWNDALPPA
ncbi:MAG: hypothetical protein HY763_14770 [Planctomycetes bacterium]|nr:hypothetical protein [Planctomycetota bacterium]